MQRDKKSSEKEEPEVQVAITQEELGTGRVKGGDILRKQLAEVTSGMDVVDLEQLLAFAEFLKARQVARSFSHRTEGASQSTHSESSASSTEQDHPSPHLQSSDRH